MERGPGRKTIDEEGDRLEERERARAGNNSARESACARVRGEKQQGKGWRYTKRKHAGTHVPLILRLRTREKKGRARERGRERMKERERHTRTHTHTHLPIQNEVLLQKMSLRWLPCLQTLWLVHPCCF